MEESIRDMLTNALDDDGDFNAVNFLRTLERNGYRRLAPLGNDGLHALAAAIEYYDGDIEQARATIERGEYRHYPDAQDYEDLGREIFFADTEKIRYEMPIYILDYLDVELLGKDMSRDGEYGQFTHFGYFAPEKW